jgi:hypothetical protein
VQEDLDPFELMEAVNIIDRLPKDFFDKIVKLNHREMDHLIFLSIFSGIKTMERSKRSAR